MIQKYRIVAASHGVHEFVPRIEVPALEAAPPQNALSNAAGERIIPALDRGHLVQRLVGRENCRFGLYGQRCQFLCDHRRKDSFGCEELGRTCGGRGCLPWGRGRSNGSRYSELLRQQQDQDAPEGGDGEEPKDKTECPVSPHSLFVAHTRFSMAGALLVLAEIVTKIAKRLCERTRVLIRTPRVVIVRSVFTRTARSRVRKLAAV